MNAADELTSRARANLPRLDELRAATRERLKQADDEETRTLFAALTQADFHAVALEENTAQTEPPLRWGFQQHDARFLRSLRDQTLGVGEEAKPLTKAQAKTLRPVMMREPYLTQVALLTSV